MSHIVNLKGKRFGRLVVLGEAGRDNWQRVTWHCLCDCGTIKIRCGLHLRKGYSKSCGCLHKDVMTKHGQVDSREYSSWENMKQRCLNSNNPHYERYGGRGITIWKPWEQFENFYADMGKRPENTSIDRIDNDGNYEPGNCRWATRIEQNNNKGVYTKWT